MNRTIAVALKKVFFIVFAVFIALQIANAQTSWTTIDAPPATGDLVAVYFTSPDDGWIAGDKGYLARTKDGGKSWTPQTLNTDENINEIYFRNDNNGYLVAGKKMFLTRDGGKSWQETRIFKPSDFKGLTPEFLSIRFPDKKLGFVLGSLLNKKTMKLSTRS